MHILYTYYVQYAYVYTISGTVNSGVLFVAQLTNYNVRTAKIRRR